jgi:hypothetical protein
LGRCFVLFHLLLSPEMHSGSLNNTFTRNGGDFPDFKGAVQNYFACVR